MIKPAKRTKEQLRNHYEVESALAAKIMNAKTPEERKEIYKTMYDELFDKVPDHPRLTQRSSPELTEFNIRVKATLVDRFLSPDLVFAEMAPGDCKFVYYVARQVKEAYGVDISDQRKQEDVKAQPANFQFATFDGYSLDLPENSIDIFFSDQLIEHIHPDETENHFRMVYSSIKPGGKYIFRIPHRLSGPHDISKYFTDTPTGFHLNEPTYREMAAMLKKTGFSGFRCYWNAKTTAFRLPYFYFSSIEWFAEKLPHKIRRKPIRLLIPYLYMIGYK